MELFTLWCGFIGAWLLFAGPIYQGALELEEENTEEANMRKTMRTITPPPKVSAWWWLLPPVKIYLGQRRRKQFYADFMAVLSPEGARALNSFTNKATSWLLVGAGGLLIAIKETYELIEALHAEHWVFWVTIFVLAVASVLNTAYRISRSKEFVKNLDV